MKSAKIISLFLIGFLLPLLNFAQTAKALPKTASTYHIVFNYYQSDSCYNFSVKLHKDSFTIEKRLDDKVVALSNGNYKSEPWSSLKGFYQTSDTTLSQLSRMSVKNFKWNGIDFMVEVVSNGKSRRYFIADIESNKILSKPCRYTLRDLKFIYTQVINQHLHTHKGNKLNNF